MSTMIKSKIQAKIRANEGTQAGVDSISKGSLIAMSSVAALVGLWAVACFVGASISTGPVAMIKGWFSALAGM
ncbi:MAG: hypothetical protein KKE17_12055 [Proteobacteria bacterium]|nr:hypothetical protein [Pseudomonadota bacterium]MBU1710730.1 hypothetical protein [Pseudomonadota bacterium]